MSWYWAAEYTGLTKKKPVQTITATFSVEASRASRAIYVAAKRAEADHGLIERLTVRVVRTTRIPPRPKHEAYATVEEQVGRSRQRRPFTPSRP